MPSYWGKDPPLKLVTNHGPADRVVAIGDIHGDAGALKKALRLGGLMGANGKWTGGKTVLVQVGDIVDRGIEEREAMELLFSLQDQAPKSGGKVYLLLGNHEVSNLVGSFRFVNKEAASHFGDGGGMLGKIKAGKWMRRHPSREKMFGRLKAFSGPVARELGRRTQVSVIVGGSVFVHAGLAPHQFFGVMSLPPMEADERWNDILHDMNVQTRRWLLSPADERRSLLRPKFLNGANTPIFARYYSRKGVKQNSAACTLLNVTLNLVGADRMVVGHSRHPQGICSNCHKRLWCIDTGMSRAYKSNGPVEVLEFGRRGRAKVLSDKPNGGQIRNCENQTCGD